MKQNGFIYLDNNATTRVDDKVMEAMLPFFSMEYANAGSSHLFGLSIHDAVEGATEQVAGLIHAKPGDIYFTSGATEAINIAIKGFSDSQRRHIVSVKTEHKAVLETCSEMERRGFNVTYLTVDNKGMVDLKSLEDSVDEQTLMVCLMLANNETGVIQPIREIAEIAHSAGAILLCDATQAVGKIPVDVVKMGIDLMPLSAHKFYGPKGIGALYISPAIKTRPCAQIHGGGQQRGLRSGTLNVPGIIGLGAACEVAAKTMDDDNLRIGRLRDTLEDALLKINGAYRNGPKTDRLYNTSNICFPGINSEKLIIALKHIAVSSGSACSAVTTEPSHVLKAMGLTDADALASIRFSLGRYTTEADIAITIEKVTELVARLRN
jgi:cysteine desulfurase